MTKPSLDEIKSLIDPSTMKGAYNAFAPKLLFQERCEILALEMMGVSRRFLAAMYNVNRSTVNFIILPSSPHYRNVRRKAQEMGREAFIAEYVTAEVVERLNAAKADADIAKQAALTNDELKAKRAAEPKGPNKSAKSAEGQHWVRDFRWDERYLVNVTWTSVVRPDGGEHEGWALFIRGSQVAKLLGSDTDTTPDFWHNTDPEHASTGEVPELFHTSKQALDSWMETHEATLAD